MSSGWDSIVSFPTIRDKSLNVIFDTYFKYRLSYFTLFLVFFFFLHRATIYRYSEACHSLFCPDSLILACYVIFKISFLSFLRYRNLRSDCTTPPLSQSLLFSLLYYSSDLCFFFYFLFRIFQIRFFLYYFIYI